MRGTITLGDHEGWMGRVPLDEREPPRRSTVGRSTPRAKTSRANVRTVAVVLDQQTSSVPRGGAVQLGKRPDEVDGASTRRRDAEGADADFAVDADRPRRSRDECRTPSTSEAGAFPARSLGREDARRCAWPNRMPSRVSRTDKTDSAADGHAPPRLGGASTPSRSSVASAEHAADGMASRGVHDEVDQQLPRWL